MVPLFFKDLFGAFGWHLDPLFSRTCSEPLVRVWTPHLNLELLSTASWESDCCIANSRKLVHCVEPSSAGGCIIHSVYSARYVYIYITAREMQCLFCVSKKNQQNPFVLYIFLENGFFLKHKKGKEKKCHIYFESFFSQMSEFFPFLDVFLFFGRFCAQLERFFLLRTFFSRKETFF